VAETSGTDAALKEAAAPPAPSAGLEDGASGESSTTETVITVTVEGGKVTVPYDDINNVTIGLRVYTNKDVPATVVGRLREDKKETKTATATATATAAVTTA
jgi:hypothetical protein